MFVTSKLRGLVLGLLLAQCTPGGSQSPLKRIAGTPQTGGQTGDPGVTDYTSIAKIAAEAGGNGSRVWLPPTEATDSSGALTLGSAKLLTLGADRLVLVDPAVGLRVINVSDPQAPVVDGQYAIGGLPVDVHVLGTRVIVTQVFPSYLGDRPDLKARYGNNEILLIDVSEPNRPRLLDKAQLPGGGGAAIVMSHWVRHAGRDVLYVVDNEWPAQPESPFLNRLDMVRSFDVSDQGISELGQLQLGAGSDPHGMVMAVRASDQLLIVASLDASVSLVDLSAADGSMTLGNHVAPSADQATNNMGNTFMDLTDSTLRMVFQGGSDGEFVEYDVHNPAEPRLVAGCPVARSYQGEADFAGDLTFVRGNYKPSGVSPSRDRANGALIRVDSAGQCSAISLGDGTVRPALRGTRMIHVGQSLDGAADAPSIVDLYDTAPAVSGALVPLASAPARNGWLPREVSVLEAAVHATAPDGSAEVNLLAVPELGVEADGSPFETTELFSFSDHTMTRRALIRPAARVLSLTPSTLAAWSQAGLALFDQSSLDAPRALGGLDLSPAFLDAIDFGNFIVREHAPLAALDVGSPPDVGYFPKPGAPVLVVDSVDASADPETATPLGRFSVSAHSRLVRTGNLLLSLSHETSAGSVDVIDLSDPQHPELASTFNSSSFDNVCYYYCDFQNPRPGSRECGCGPRPDLIDVPHGLVARLYGSTPDPDPRSPAYQAGPDLIGFLVIDLRDPRNPTTSVVDLDAGRFANAFADGARLYFSYDVPVPGSRVTSMDAAVPDTEQVRYYYRQLDVSDLSAPVLGPSINTPGELVAIDRQGSLYTREIDASHIAAVHRLALRNGQASIQATYELGDNTIHYAGLDDQGHLLVEVMGPTWIANQVLQEGGVGWNGPATRLVVLDAASLELVSEIEIDRRAVLRDVREGRAVYEGSAGVFVVDLRDARNPTLQAFHSVDLPMQPALFFDGHRIVVQASGGLRRIDAEESNLF